VNVGSSSTERVLLKLPALVRQEQLDIRARSNAARTRSRGALRDRKPEVEFRQNTRDAGEFFQEKQILVLLLPGCVRTAAVKLTQPRSRSGVVPRRWPARPRVEMVTHVT